MDILRLRYNNARERKHFLRLIGSINKKAEGEIGSLNKRVSKRVFSSVVAPCAKKTKSPILKEDRRSASLHELCLR